MDREASGQDKELNSDVDMENSSVEKQNREQNEIAENKNEELTQKDKKIEHFTGITMVPGILPTKSGVAISGGELHNNTVEQNNDQYTHKVKVVLLSEHQKALIEIQRLKEHLKIAEDKARMSEILANTMSNLAKESNERSIKFCEQQKRLAEMKRAQESHSTVNHQSQGLNFSNKLTQTQRGTIVEDNVNSVEQNFMIQNMQSTTQTDGNVQNETQTENENSNINTNSEDNTNNNNSGEQNWHRFDEDQLDYEGDFYNDNTINQLEARYHEKQQYTNQNIRSSQPRGRGQQRGHSNNYYNERQHNNTNNQLKQRGKSAIFSDPRTKDLEWSSIYKSFLAGKKCNICWQWGHIAESCLLKDMGLYFCGACEKIADHKSDTCPNPSQEYIMNMLRRNNVRQIHQ